MTIDHIDRNTKNNSLENLRIADYKLQAENRSRDYLKLRTNCGSLTVRKSGRIDASICINSRDFIKAGEIKLSLLNGWRKCRVTRWLINLTNFAGLVQWQNGSLVSCASDVRFLCPAPEPTTWDPSAREPTLPYPHLPGLSPGFLFRPQTINSRCPVAIVSDGLFPTTTQHPGTGGVECNV